MAPKELPVVQDETPFIDLIKDSWEPFKQNWLVTSLAAGFLSYVPFLIIGIPAGILAFIAAAIAAMINKDLVMLFLFPIGVMAGLAFGAAFNLVRAGWLRMLLKICHGEPAKFADLKSGMPWFINLFITMLIIGVATTIGSLFLVVPGIFIAVRTSLAPYLVVDEDLSPIEAIMKSNEMVAGYSWQILGYYCIMGFTNLVLGFIPVVQILLLVASTAFFDLVLTRIYLYRKNNSNPAKLIPPAMAP